MGPQDGYPQGFASSGISLSDPETSPSPVAVFLSHLLIRLSYDDPMIRPLADALRLTGTSGSTTGALRKWDLSDVFSLYVRKRIAEKGVNAFEPFDSEWGLIFGR